MTMAEKFHSELKNLRTETLEMTHLGRLMLRSAVDALIRQDKELAVSVVARKEEIRAMEIRLEEHCYHLIAFISQWQRTCGSLPARSK